MTKILDCTVGLPRSGKTTWAQSQGVPIVSPDAIRYAIHGQRFIQLAEPFVWATARVMVRSLFFAGHPRVILDATNTTRKARDQWVCRDGFPDDWQTRFKLVDTSQAVCLERAVLEGDSYILPIITRMAAQWEPLEADEALWVPPPPVLMWEIGVEGDQFNSHEKGPDCRTRGCVPIVPVV